MLKFLNITNLAVIHHLSVDFHEGLNLLTGETGTGKSMVVDALGLLLGGRAAAEMIRTGERAAVVEGLFELPEEQDEIVCGVLSEAGIDREKGEELAIRREVQAGGRSRVFINDRSVTTATLKSLQPFLVEIYGQGEQYALAFTRAQLEMLDGFAGCENLRREAARAYAEWKAALGALRSLERDEAERERVSDFLRFQIAEIEKANPRAGEDDELTAEKRLLAHAERALELSAGAYAELYERDDSALAQLASVRKRLQELSHLDGRVKNLQEALEAASLMLTDVAEGLRGYGTGVDFSPTRLGEVEDRLAELERLKRKYGRDLRGLNEVKEELKARLDEIGNRAARELELRREVEGAELRYIPIAKRLTAIRRAAVPRLEKRLTEELRQVALERAQFVVSLETAGLDESRRSTDGVGEEPTVESPAMKSFWTPCGADRVEFLFSANVGESVRPLARIASGGELSRLMLTLRTVCRNSRDGKALPVGGTTLVFDEIDAGIGGRAAEAVGRRLRSLAATQQILCVTHQPQIARFADHHYVVEKQIREGRTLTTVEELHGEERVGELARMIGGAEDVKEARETARWMLASVASRGGAARLARGKKSSKA